MIADREDFDDILIASGDELRTIHSRYETMVTSEPAPGQPGGRYELDPCGWVRCIQRYGVSPLSVQ